MESMSRRCPWVASMMKNGDTGSLGPPGGTRTCMQSRHQFAWQGLSIQLKVVCREKPRRIIPTYGCIPAGVPRLYSRIPELSSPNYFFLDLYDTYPHNRCVGWFEISTSPRFRNIFCKKRACGYTNSHLHPFKKRKNDYVHSDVAAMFYVSAWWVHTSSR